LTLEGLVTQCVPGAKILDLCEFGTKVLEAAAAKLYTKKVNGKAIDRGVAFPVCVSVNDTVCNFSPLENEEVVSDYHRTKNTSSFLPVCMYLVSYPVQVHHIKWVTSLPVTLCFVQGERRAETDPQTVLRQEEKKKRGGVSLLGSFCLLRQRPGLSRITPSGVDPGDLEIPSS
jgi:hypothetical protein